MITVLSFLLASLERGFSEDLKRMLEPAFFDLVQGRNELKSYKLEEFRKGLGVDFDVVLKILSEDIVHAFLLFVGIH